MQCCDKNVKFMNGIPSTVEANSSASDEHLGAFDPKAGRKQDKEKMRSKRNIKKYL
ncbi:hypothetical protein [Klebsiella pneumoniae]|uniref:hypothetical protein n=1 Tax=Klebsiella pneumoniae TaxID=573 RepID=UPI003B27D668